MLVDTLSEVSGITLRYALTLTEFAARVATNTSRALQAYVFCDDVRLVFDGASRPCVIPSAYNGRYTKCGRRKGCSDAGRATADTVDTTVDANEDIVLGPDMDTLLEPDTDTGTREFTVLEPDMDTGTRVFADKDTVVVDAMVFDGTIEINTHATMDRFVTFMSRYT